MSLPKNIRSLQILFFNTILVYRLSTVTGALPVWLLLAHGECIVPFGTQFPLQALRILIQDPKETSITPVFTTVPCYLYSELI